MHLQNGHMKSMAIPIDLIHVEVAYALPKQQILLAIQIPASSSVEQAIIASGILQQYPEIDLQKNLVGIYGKQVSLSALLKNGDRIEIYRSLLQNPNAARLARAKQC